VPQVPAVSRDTELKTAVAGVFADAGPLARTVPEYEARPAQLLMAAAVADTLEHGGVLLAEAGT
jgi:ATP-dependent DNA helicase DinG